MQKTVFVKITGQVQGVGFRWCSYEKFVEFELQGKAENMPDGTLEITVSGEEENLKNFLRWARIGPQGARVANMEYKVVENAEPISAEINKKPDEEE